MLIKISEVEKEGRTRKEKGELRRKEGRSELAKKDERRKKN